MAAHNLQQHCPCCEFTALKHSDWIEYNSDQNIVELAFLKTLLVNSTERILQKTIWCIFCRSSFWNGYITNQLRWQTNGLQRQAAETFSLSLPSPSLTTFSHANCPALLSLRSPASAAGVCQRRCWWTRSSSAPRWKSRSEPRIRATPAWPTSPPRPRG